MKYPNVHDTQNANFAPWISISPKELHDIMFHVNSFNSPKDIN